MIQTISRSDGSTIRFSEGHRFNVGDKVITDYYVSEGYRLSTNVHVVKEIYPWNCYSGQMVVVDDNLPALDSAWFLPAEEA